LDGIRGELRQHDYLPVSIDCGIWDDRDTAESISTLAHIARFVIADLTEAERLSQALPQIIPDLPSVPIQPLVARLAHDDGLLEYLNQYPLVLKPHLYENVEDLLTSFKKKVITPAEKKAKTITKAH
jgi:hypothetical protein